MDQIYRPARGRFSLVARIAFCLGFLIALFVFENLWIDPWIRHKSHRIPSFVPERQSGLWFVAFAIGAMAVVFILFCLILLIKDRGASVWIKLAIGLTFLCVCLLGTQWFRITNGQSGLVQLMYKPHKIVLTWRASTSPVIGYNVYRRTGASGIFVRLTVTPVRDLTYVDDTVRSGATYEYVARSVDAIGRESVNSNMVTLTVP